MSLHEAADGILETHVTWQDVEEAFQKSLGTKATLGEIRKVTNIGDMKGFMSKIALVEVEWNGVEKGIELPQKFIIKIASQMSLLVVSKIMKMNGGDGFDDAKIRKLAKFTQEVHNREVGTYKLLMKFGHPNIPYTKVFALKEFDGENDLKGYIIADFVPNVHTIGMCRTIPADELISAVRGIATFAALGETLKPEEKSFSGGPDYLNILFDEFLSEETQKKNNDDLREAFSVEYQDKLERLLDVFWQYRSLAKKYSQISELLGFKLVLNHGDLWQSNMLHSLDKDGKMKLEAMIDWQGLSRMPPGLDLSRLFVGCLSHDDRREHGVEMLKLYHDTFNSVLGKELFSFQELLGSYNLFVPMAAMLLLPGLPQFFHTQIPEHEKADAKEKINKTMIGMLEDTLKAHEYNLKHFPAFMKV